VKFANAGAEISKKQADAVAQINFFISMVTPPFFPDLSGQLKSRTVQRNDKTLHAVGGVVNMGGVVRLGGFAPRWRAVPSTVSVPFVRHISFLPDLFT